MRENGGNIISPGTHVTFYGAGILQALMDGQAVPIVSQAANYVRVYVLAGDHKVALNRAIDTTPPAPPQNLQITE
jgi:hypothetical protein